MENNSTKRFSNRVEDYVKYRPTYPEALIPFLQTTYGLTPDQRIADIGSGTGISAELFLKAGYAVTGVEPNREMREKSVELLASYERFTAQNGIAEQTGLAEGSVDGIIAGQAFHWFDRDKAKAEFKRILKPGGSVVLIWNERKTVSDFERKYDELIIAHGRDYVKVDHRNIHTEDIEAFFAPDPVKLDVFANEQVFDFEGLEGRLLSSSYMPARGEEGYEAMIADLRNLFDRSQSDGKITIHYDTKVYVGRLS
jgi:SAM-dependent methyltransferase